MEKIFGNKIFLRPITLADTDLIVRLRNSKFVQDQFIWRALLTSETHINWMETKVFSGKVVQYVICEMDTTPIGSVYYRDIDSNEGAAEFGIFIDENYAGRGYGTDAINTFLKLGFEIMKLNKIYLRVVDSNSRARRVYESIGFTQIREEAVKSYPTGEELKVIFMEFNKIKGHSNVGEMPESVTGGGLSSRLFFASVPCGYGIALCA